MVIRGGWNSDHFITQTKIKVKCQTCQKEFRKKRSDVGRSVRHFCSLKCHGIADRKP